MSHHKDYTGVLIERQKYSREELDALLPFFDFFSAVKKHSKQLFPAATIKDKDFKNQFDNPPNFYYVAAKQILKKTNIYSIDGCLYAYIEDAGYYKKYHHKDFGAFITQALKKTSYRQKLTKHDKCEIAHILLDYPKIQTTLDFFDCQERYINVKNGVVDIVTLELLPHDAKYGFTSVLNGNFLSKITEDDIAKTVFAQMIKRSFPSIDDRIRLVQSLAFAVSNCHTQKIAWYWFGVSNSGKSTLLNIIRRLVGPEMISNIRLDKLADRFSLSALYAKKLNINGECSSLHLKDLSNFKNITGGDSVPVEFKGQDIFSAVLKMNFIFASNYMLKLVGAASDDSVCNRFEFLRFDTVVAPEDRDENIDQKLAAESDFILSYLLYILHLWYLNGRKFLATKSSKKLKNQLQKGSPDSVAKFYEENCIRDENASTSIKKLYHKYKDFCRINEWEALSKNTFGDFIRKISGTSSKKIHDGWVIKGLALR